MNTLQQIRFYATHSTVFIVNNQTAKQPDVQALIRTLGFKRKGFYFVKPNSEQATRELTTALSELFGSRPSILTTTSPTYLVGEPQRGSLVDISFLPDYDKHMLAGLRASGAKLGYGTFYGCGVFFESKPVAEVEALVARLASEVGDNCLTTEWCLTW
jgi:hypothetical protein